jgi:electron-transferring-flavoprotein dehydrogenase
MRPGPPASLLAEAVIELLRAGKPFTRENLERTYVAQRRASWLEEEAASRRSRATDFTRRRHRPDRHGVAGFTQRRLSLARRRAERLVPDWRSSIAARFRPTEIRRIVEKIAAPSGASATTP